MNSRGIIYEMQMITQQYIVGHSNITKLFLPSVVRDWNGLPEEAKQLNSLLSFKTYLNRERKNVPKHFYYDRRKYQILHTTLRTGCGALNNDLYLKNIRFSFMYMWYS